MLPSGAGFAVQRPASCALALPSVFPERYSDTAFFSATVSDRAWIAIVPLVNDRWMASAVRSLSASFGGVRPVGWSWQLAQLSA